MVRVVINTSNKSVPYYVRIVTAFLPNFRVIAYNDPTHSLNEKETVKFNPFKNQRGWGVMDVVFWVVVIAVVVWVAKQYILHPEGLNPRGATHSAMEDSK